MAQADAPRRIAAVDVGFASSGIAVMEHTRLGWEPVALRCLRTEPSANKKHLRVADDDAERVMSQAREFLAIIARHNVIALVVETPHGGAKSSRASRCMGLATGMIATIAAATGVAVEWYGPDQTRSAATGDKKATKTQVINGASKAFGSVDFQAMPNNVEREAIADALATFLAALELGNVVRMIG